MHASPPALIDACMSFRIDQLQEVRTAPAAHEGHQWPEGPVTPSTRRSWLAKQARVVGFVALGRKGRQRPTSSILAAIAQRRACALMMVGAHVTVRRRGSLCWVHGSIVDETRNAEDPREVPGRSGGSGWETLGGGLPFSAYSENIQGNQTGRSPKGSAPRNADDHVLE